VQNESILTLHKRKIEEKKKKNVRQVNGPPQAQPARQAQGTHLLPYKSDSLQVQEWGHLQGQPRLSQTVFLATMFPAGAAVIGTRTNGEGRMHGRKKNRCGAMQRIRV
jgi:hypothetical protein